MSLALNKKFTQVFQAIISTLHSLHHLRGIAIAIAIGRNFASAHAGCSLSMSNHLDTCDSLHVINPASDVSIAAILLLRYISYLTLRVYLAARHYGHVAAIRIFILTNCYGITNLLLRKFTFTENQTCLRNFYTTKIWSHTVACVIIAIPSSAINLKLHDYNSLQHSNLQ